MVYGLLARNEDDEPRDPDAFATTLVSVKSFLKFLSSHIVSTTTIACESFFTLFVSSAHSLTGICHKHCIIMYVYIGDVGEPGDVLTFYIPAMHDGVED